MNNIMNEIAKSIYNAIQVIIEEYTNMSVEEIEEELLYTQSESL